MYAKYGMFKEMQTVFDGMKNRTIVSWCTITAGYAGQGHIAQVLSLFSEMIHNCIKPNHVILSCVLRACGGNGARMHGTLIHDFMIRNNLHSDLITGNTLIDMYIRCGTIEDAWKAFIAMPKHDPVSWNTMISGYASEGYYIDALRLLGKMQQEVDHVGKPLALCIIKACIGLGVLHKSKLLHSLLLETGEESDIMIQNTLVDMYAKCGSLEDAQAVFDNLQVQNLVSWGAIISAYATHGQFDHAFQLFIKMQLTGRKPNDVIYLSLLRLCKSSANVSDSRLLHDQIIKTGFETVIAVGNALIDMYASYGSLDEGKRVLDTLPARDEVSWGAMLD
jgi:pentatricopeptide repeat protein